MRNLVLKQKLILIKINWRFLTTLLQNNFLSKSVSWILNNITRSFNLVELYYCVLSSINFLVIFIYHFFFCWGRYIQSFMNTFGSGLNVHLWSTLKNFLYNTLSIEQVWVSEFVYFSRYKTVFVFKFQLGKLRTQWILEFILPWILEFISNQDL